MAPSSILGLLKCGCITGVLWSFAQILLVVSINETGLLAPGAMSEINGEWFFILDILTGIWAIGIYSLARSYFQSFSSAVAATVIAWWLIQSLVSIKSGGFEFTAAQATVISLVSFTSIGLAMLAGAWPYEKLSRFRAIVPDI